MEIPFFIKISLFLCMSLGTVYLLIWVSLKEILPLFEIQFSTFWYLFPFILLLTLALLSYIANKINEIIYSYVYIFVFSIFGHLVNSFTCCLTTMIIKIFTKNLSF